MLRKDQYLTSLDKATDFLSLGEGEEVSRVEISPGKDYFIVTFTIRKAKLKGLRTKEISVCQETGKILEGEDNV